MQLMPGGAVAEQGVRGLGWIDLDSGPFSSVLLSMQQQQYYALHWGLLGRDLWEGGSKGLGDVLGRDGAPGEAAQSRLGPAPSQGFRCCLPQVE